MTTATISPAGLKVVCDDVFPNTGTVGYIALLKADLATSLSFTANASTNVLTTGSAHNLVTGSRVRVATGGVLPAPLAAATDYFAIVTGGSALKLATSLVNAEAGTEIDLSDAGTGSHTLNEQVLNATDSIAVLLNKELTHPVWSSRAAISSLGASSTVGANAEKAPLTTSINNTDASTLSFKHVLYLIGSGVSATIGSSTGIDYVILSTEATTQSVVTGETKALVTTLQVQPL